MNMKHICSLCGKSFKTEKGYLEHKCEETGYKPTEADHLGDVFKRISEAALERGKARKEK